MLQNQDNARPPVAFDPYAPGVVEDPAPMLARLREEAPILYWEQGRTWVVSRYDDVVALIRDPRFTTDRAAWEFAKDEQMVAVRCPEFDEVTKGDLFALSPKDHARVRKLVSPSFTPRAIERLRPAVQRIVDETIAAATTGDTLDVARDFAEPIPVSVISAMLNIPERHQACFHRFADASIRQLFPSLITPAEAEKISGYVREGLAMIGEVIEDRRKNPIEGDILTSLIQAEEQGDRLNKMELLSLVAALIVGGSETTVHLIGFMVLNLLRRPEVLAQVQAEPELIKGVLEEVLRLDNFGKLGLQRYATEDVEIGGVTIKKGQMVMLLIPSALRDEAVFPRADTFDPRRDAGASIAFGQGAHYCLGVNLARLEGQIAVGTLLQRFPRMQLLGDPVFGPHPAIRKLDSLKVRLNS